MPFSQTAKNILKFYVYILYDEYNVPFYVGKGYENRVFEHENETLENTNNINKFMKIQEMLSKGSSIIKKIVHAGLTEEEAYACETTLINLFKSQNIPLTNLQDGHKNILGTCLTPEQIENRFNQLLINTEVFKRNDKILIYIARPNSKFSITNFIKTLKNKERSFFQNKPSPLYLAVFHKRILEGIFTVSSVQKTTENNNGVIQFKIVFTDIVDSPNYQNYIGFQFVDVPKSSQYSLIALY